ncbi:uncharacterized protein IL334_005032 [Kwoniella shivajii]|uniref:Probable RNA polymerase II nuclear localization protein SLC7A6OS n=1 Tax=Kwoniella shivajii TaxID=564305 RepID=A0ABZ1D381_9TREE|nr:hypothetical protein IL334_005032 [Kwoniella shivajii]
MQINRPSPAGPSGSGTGSSYTVLRIKRKATEAPLSSLVIQDSEPRLRAKRRRDVSGRPRGVFRLAETVPGTWQGKGEEGEVLKSRIQGLISSSSQPDSPISLPKSPLVSQQTVTPSLPSSTASPPLPSASITQAKPSSPQHVPKTVSPPPPLPPPHFQSQGQTQYRVIPPLSPRTKAMLPPKLLTTAETKDGSSPLVFVDAQAVSSAVPSMSNATIPRPSKSNPQDDKEMDHFLPMLEEYLKLEEESKKSEPVSTPLEEEWVYDLYYRDNNSASISLGLGAGDGVSIGELLGFEDISPPSSVSGSEPEDEADEDSNDEDYYRNDYPEDEDADEDMEGFRGGGGESDWSEEYEDDEEERGEWGYR